MSDQDDAATAAKLAECLDEEQTALTNCARVLQGMQNAPQGQQYDQHVAMELEYWQTMARLAQVRGRLVEIRGY